MEVRCRAAGGCPVGFGTAYYEVLFLVGTYGLGVAVERGENRQQGDGDDGLEEGWLHMVSVLVSGCKCRRLERLRWQN